MDTNLAIHLSERAFELLAEQALATGTTPAELAASVVENAYSAGRTMSVEADAARADFERCFGTIDLGHPIGLSNPAIDNDLAREYGIAGGPF